MKIRIFISFSSEVGIIDNWFISVILGLMLVLTRLTSASYVQSDNVDLMSSCLHIGTKMSSSERSTTNNDVTLSLP